MKFKQLFIFCCTVLIQYRSISQTIRRVNNIGGVTGLNVYSSAQAAHDASSPGDIIYIEPSSTSYGDLAVRKRLTIYGPGFWLSENPNTTHNKANATFGKIYFNAQSQNSIVSGIVADQIYVYVDNITITRCYLFANIQLAKSLNTDGAYSISISKCTTRGIYGNYWYDANYNRIYPQNINIKNNIITSTDGSSLNELRNSTISNNVISAVLADVYNCTFTNNIFTYFSSIVGFGGVGDCSFLYNVQANGNDIGSSNGNIPSVTLNQIFVNADPFGQTKVIDNYFLLKTNSPALTPGSDGTQRGIFGGASPFVLSGQPPVPIITELYNSGSANASTPLNVKITVRSNN